MHRYGVPLATAALILLMVLSLPARGGGASSTLDRDADPVVLTGAALPQFVGAQPSRIVAFKFAGTWQQVPVQVDERRAQSFGPSPCVGRSRRCWW